MATAALRPGRVTTLRSGPWQGVWDSDDPYDADQQLLVDLRNCYIPDPLGRSGILSRPGFLLLNNGDPIFTSVSAFRCQAIYSHTMLDGSTVNLVVFGGHLYRANATYSVYTDVTPAGITIDANIGTRVFFASLDGTLIASDGVNRPWVCTDPSATTLAASYIDYDGHGVSWTIYGNVVVYDGAVMGILNQVNGVSRRGDISWANPGTPTIGWQQTDFDNNWTLSKNQAGPLFALWPTNLAVYYFRERSIGYFTGTVGPELASSATEDSVGFNVGAQAAQLIQEFGNAIFFGDANGRPYLFQSGTPPKDIWRQLRRVVQHSTTGFPGTTQAVATSALESNLNLYCAAIWSPTPSTQAPPTELVIFDANSGGYQGRWKIGAVNAPIAIECVGNFVDAGGRSTMIVAGSKDPAPATGGYLWAFSGFSATQDSLTTEDGVFLTTENGDELVTEGTAENWKDDGDLPDIFLQTDRLAYDEDMVMNVDQATVITLVDTPCVVQVGTTAVFNAVQGTPEPSPSQDGTNRLVVGCDVFGRGPAVKVRPATADQQWAAERVSLRVIPSNAGPEDA